MERNELDALFSSLWHTVKSELAVIFRRDTTRVVSYFSVGVVVFVLAQVVAFGGQNRPSDSDLLKRIDKATSFLQSYDLGLKIHKRTYDANSPKKGPRIQEESVRDVYSAKIGRSVSRDLEMSSGSKTLTFNDQVWRSVPDTSVASPHQVMPLKVSTGHDYLTFLRPIVSNKDCIDLFREKLSEGLLEVSGDGTSLILAVPSSSIADYLARDDKRDKIGVRMWVDVSRGFMPTAFETFVKKDGKPFLLRRFENQLSRLPNDRWVVSKVTEEQFSISPAHLGKKLSDLSLTVDLGSSKWNPDTLQFARANGLPNAGKSGTPDQELTRLSTGEVLASKGFDVLPSEMSRKRVFLLALNGAVLIVLAIAWLVYRGKRRRSAKVV